MQVSRPAWPLGIHGETWPRPMHLPYGSAAISPCCRWRRRCSCPCRAWALPQRPSRHTACWTPTSKWLATVPIFLTHAGIMATTIPASLLMGAIGRRAGFTLGALFGVVFGGLACAALYWHSFPWLCAAAVAQGMQAAFFWYFRLAAADAVPLPICARAISLVMAGGVLAGFLGPQTAKWAVDWFAPVTFAGVYVACAVFSLAVLALVQCVRIPQLSASERAEGGRPMAIIARQPAYRVALASSVFGYAVMTLTMSATPLAMHACGFAFADSATVIQAHIVAMFLPSFFTGHLIARFGVLPVIAAGGLIELGCALVNLAGVDFANFLVANILVGLGWNFAYVGGSTLLTTHLHRGRAGQGPGRPRLCRLCRDRLGGGAVGRARRQGRLGGDQPRRPAPDGRRYRHRGMAYAVPAPDCARRAGRITGRPTEAAPCPSRSTPPPTASRPPAISRTSRSASPSTSPRAP